MNLAMAGFLCPGFSLFSTKTKRGIWWYFLEKCGFGWEMLFCGILGFVFTKTNTNKQKMLGLGGFSLTFLPLYDTLNVI
jgi:hypothetical protein